jgi:hypothetical protein
MPVIARFGSPSVEENCPRSNPALTPGRDMSEFFPNCTTRAQFHYLLSSMDLGVWEIQFDAQRRVYGKEFLIMQ